MSQKNEPLSLDPEVEVVDEEKTITELLEVANDADGNQYPFSQFVGDRVFTPVPGERHDGTPVDFKNVDPAVVFRMQPGKPSNTLRVRRYTMAVFCLGGSEAGSWQKSRARAKHVYRTLVGRLQEVNVEVTGSGVVLYAKEIGTGTPEQDPGIGSWWTYRSTWDIGLRVKGAGE